MTSSSTAEHEPEENRPTPTLGVLLWRGIRARCGACGQGPLFQGWFRMHPQCSHCGYRFERGPGYWLGSIFVNYGLTALMVTAAYLILFFADIWPQEVVMGSLLAFCLLFPLWFFRIARSVWSAVDLYFDPPRAGEFGPPTSEPMRPER